MISTPNGDLMGMVSIENTLCIFEKINFKPGDVLFVRYPEGLWHDNVEAIRDAMSNLKKEGPLSTVEIVISPNSFNFQNMPLADLQRFRDQINEAIYDKERQPR